ncbi:ZIP family metal transporter [Parahaliea sp. F7430]|uniref:ZIP family metal transporter n=1 Tax=Sediminihaliea albiluteola TaxID=2758564 RepID=A0A7W2TY98_9GAMM|nr:ZIP family metal transporter [Sediminihaliea albiluteola]MBA6414162.1 ZIP family metal transporter [Sediminihaliea albiluteola]
MTASPTLLLSIYCIAIALFSLLGGLLPSWVRMTHIRTQLIMSFVSGLMLGVAFFHLLPHSIALQESDQAVDISVWWLMTGLIVMLLLLRMFHFHQHDFSHDEHAHGQGHAHKHDHDHGHDGPKTRVNGLSWVGIALGLALHTLIDGVALGAVLQGEATTGTGIAGLLGVGVFLAILLHKPLDAISIITVMEAGGWSRSARTLANVAFALMCPLGAMLFYFGVDLLGPARHYGVAVALAFSAGAFICIALSDLLPEVHFHSHDRGKLTFAFLAGIVLAYSIGSLEPASAHVAHGQEEHTVWLSE